ncbi:ATP-binding cassette domain-containing protein [Gilliamella sp. Pra-s65]|uniref:ABC transporter ATP-binding protein n=1 Tax=unclassified Gilliamella TaxID=2685620 RepID=UPI001365852F|nr:MULTISPECIES: ABC transporter ATP-binding protein [unclassified Gilliamella]MWN89325.1 ATP-binding cassette domain-containing protein [Gilliamella sp. Pra-s65]MWP72368.1 ATP-binding cassette domain-containing protein [Gilliamella sp. Pra-s52]
MYQFFEKLVSSYPKDEPQSMSKNFFSFIWQSTKGTRLLLLLLIIFSALGGAFEAFLYAILGRVIDWIASVEPNKFWQQEKTTLVLLALIILASTFIIGLQTIIKHQCLAGNFPMRMRWNLHRLVLNQSMHFFQNEFAGRISAKVMQTALAIRDTCFLVSDIFIYVLISFITMATIIGQLNIWLLIPFVTWCLIYGIAMYYFIPRLSKVASMQADARSTMTGRVTDAYTNIMTVKLFSHSGNEAKYAQESMDEFLVTVNKQMRLVSTFEIVNHLLSVSLILSTTGVALWLWTNQLIGIGAIATTTAVALRLNGFSHWIMWEMTALFENIGVVKDGINTFSITKTIVDQPNASKLNITQGKIEFKHINFSYDEKKQISIIKNLDLTIQPGEKIGLVGRSGAGKSSLINLLLRFYDLQSGKIIIDGQDITSVTQESLRAQIGMVTQDTSLLHRTVRENLLYGNNQATEEQMITAAQKAYADDFIKTLVDASGRKGYDAFVGERGIKLSGGQRQRIAIARVILKNAPILLLDEATSALDSEIEQAIQESLYTLMEGKTVIAIAHRLSTIAAMDKLIVLDQGKVIEQGTHQELLKKNGLYAQLWKHQSGGFLGENI